MNNTDQQSGGCLRGVWSSDDSAWYAELMTRFGKQKLQMNELGNVDPLKDEIPKIIHQIWLGPSSIPHVCHDWMESWKLFHPTWAYRLWTKDDIASLQLYNQKRFQEADNFGEKSDILRYEILAQFGGLYVDVDFKCLASFDELIKTFSFITGVSNTNAMELNNALIASSPDHPIMCQLLEAIKHESPIFDVFSSQEISSSIAQFCDQPKRDVMTAWSRAGNMQSIGRTGPGLLTRIFMKSVGWKAKEKAVDGILVPEQAKYAVALPAEYFYPISNCSETSKGAEQDTANLPKNAMAIHFWLKSWQSLVESSREA